MTNYFLLNLAVAPFVIGGLRLLASWTWITTIIVWLSVVYCVYVVTALLQVGWILLG